MSNRAEFEKYFRCPAGVFWDNEFCRYDANEMEYELDADEYNKMFQVWEVARAQSGQDVEPCGWLNKRGEILSADQKARLIESRGIVAASIRTSFTIPLYTQPAQQGSVPESVPSRDDLVQCLLATRGQSEGVAADAILWLFSAATPQPEGDGWVKCSERLPTEADEDVCRQIWGWIDNKGIGGKWIRMSASEIKDMSENKVGPICIYWKPTGLKRPRPPKEGK